IYVLNNKRAELSEIEARYGVTIEVQPDGNTEGARMSVEASGPPPENMPHFEPIIDEDDEPEEAIPFADDEDDEAEERPHRDRPRRDDDDAETPRRGRRRRGGRGRDRDRDSQPRESDASAVQSSDEEGGEAARKKRRGRRGGRGRRSTTEGGESRAPETVQQDISPMATDEEPTLEPTEAPAKPKRASRARKPSATIAEAEVAPVTETPSSEDALPKPKRVSRARKAAAPAEQTSASDGDSGDAESAEAPNPAVRKRAASAKKTADTAAPSTGKAEELANETGDRRRGWWQRTFGPE
ncbi:MAG: hypothetical protein ABL874_13475, partial [Sphingopyxis sp.]